MLRIVTGRSGSGKTEELIRIMRCCERSIYIVPEQYSFAAEKKITKTFGMSGLGKCEVYSLRRLAYKLNENFNTKRGKSIDAAGRIMVLSDIVKNKSDSLTLFGGSARRGDMAKESSVIITTLKQYDITKEKIDFAIEKTENSLLKKKLSDCKVIGEAYDEFLKTGYSDSDDLLEDLINNIPRSEKMKKCDIFIDSFTAFTPLEMKVISQMLTNCKSVTVSLCSENGNFDEFATARKTEEGLKRLCKKIGVDVLPTVKKEGAMYTAAEELKVLEKSFFEDVVYNEKTDNIKVFKAKNEYEEAVWAAREVESLCREKGYRYRDIAIVARDMAQYEKEFVRVFDRFRIPLFMDKKTPLSSEAAAIFALGAIRIISGGWKNEAVFSYMKSPFSPLKCDESDRLENYCLASGVRWGDWKREEDWDMCPSVMEGEGDDELCASMDALRRRLVSPLIKLEEKIKGKKTGREFAVAFYEFLEDCALGDKIEALSEKLSSTEAFVAERMRQVYELLISVLESFEVTFGERKISAEEFLNIFSAGIDSVEIGIIPKTADSVCAGSIDRARGHGAKCVIIVGAAEGRFPASPKDTGIFTNYDRQELAQYSIELPPDTLGKAFMEESLVYSALTCATEKLSVSFSLNDENPSPSSIVKRIKKVFPLLEVKEEYEGVEKITSDYSAYEAFAVEYAALCRGEEVDDEWYGALEYYKNHDLWRERIEEIEKYTLYENKTALIREELLRSRYGSEIKTSVSRLEQYSKCPFSYFANVTLGLKERKELEVTAADSGTFLHEFVDRFGKCLKDENISWRDVESGYIDKKTEEITLELLGQINRHMLSSPRITHLFAQLKRIAKRSVTALCEHMKKGRFEPLGYEIVFDEKGEFKPLKIELPNGQKVSLRGRVDRADILDTDRGKFVRIIDYKSGNKSFSVQNIYYGFDLQLAIYLTALCEGGNMRPAGMLYFKIDDPVIEGNLKMEQAYIDNKLRGELKMDGLVLEDDEILSAMDSSYETGSDVIPVKKKKDGSFTSASKIATEGEFGALSKHAKKTVKRLCNEILSGNVGISPVRGACDWCEMKSLCGFDTSIKGSGYRYVEKLNDRDALLKVIEENK